jgi:ubiquinone biosynthesis protein
MTTRRNLRTLVRLGSILRHAAPLAAAAAQDRIRPSRRRRNQARAFGPALERCFARLGGAVLKAGQVLATRPDLVSPDVRDALGNLLDQVEPMPWRTAHRVLLTSLSQDQRRAIKTIERRPLAAGAVAQVHVATLWEDERRVVVKIRRPEAKARFDADLEIGRQVTTILDRIPWFRATSISAAYQEIARSVSGQLDLQAEGECQRTIGAWFGRNDEVIIPEPLDRLSGSDVLVMTYVESARRIDAQGIDPQVRRRALAVGLRALYSMIFECGTVHCDFHPGNLLVTQEGKLVILDFGFVARLDRESRQLLAKLFLAIATNNPSLATTVVLQSAEPHQGLDRLRLESDLAQVVDRAAGRRPGEFQIAVFVLDLFDVHRKHGLRGSPAFTMAIMSLVAYEGLLKSFAPDLDFQREAIPYVFRALSDRPRPEAGPRPAMHVEAAAAKLLKEAQRGFVPLAAESVGSSGDFTGSCGTKDDGPRRYATARPIAPQP